MDFLPRFGESVYQIKWFTIIYVITIVPCWVTLFLALKALAKKKLSSFTLWSAALLVLLALPYAFVLASMNNIIWQVWLAVLLVVVFSYYKLLVNNHGKSSDWFWDWYAKSYDTLLHFTPYVKLTYEVASAVPTNEQAKCRVLEIGCGTGNIANQFTNNVNVEYIGVDSAQNMLDIARKKNVGKNFSFQKIDLDNEPLTFGVKFNIIVINNVLYALKDYKKIITQLRSLLVSDGKLVVSEPLRNSSIGRITSGFIKADGFLGIFKILIHLPSFIVLMVANIMITRIKHIREQNFFGESELAEVLNDSGFAIISSKRVYEEQNIMFVAVPQKT